MDYKPASVVDDFMYGSNVASSHVVVRMGFLRKVYGILSAQLALTTLIGTVIMMLPQVKEFVQMNTWVLIANLGITLLILFALMAKRTVYPTNYYLLTAFTVMEAMSIGVVCSFYDKWIVIEAFFITTTLVACLTVYTLQSKRDFSAWGAALYAGLWILIFGGFLQIFFQNDIFHSLLSLGGALLFCFFIIFDTSMIMKTLSPEEYILGVINLYLDILNLFLEILKILDSLKRN